MNRADQRPYPASVGWAVLLSALLAISLLLNLVLAIILFHRVDILSANPETQRSLPCAAIPTRFILQEPGCADKLLRAMNVTNVHVLPKDSVVPGAAKRANATPQNVSAS